MRRWLIAATLQALLGVSACSLLWPYDELGGSSAAPIDALPPVDAAIDAPPGDVRPTWSKCPDVGWCELGLDTILGYECPSPGPSAYCADMFDHTSSGTAIAHPDENLMIFWGGNTNYPGNEIYTLVLNDQPYMERRTEPSAHSVCAAANDDGTPPARDTFDGLAYVPNAAGKRSMFVFGGSCDKSNAYGTAWTLDLDGIAAPNWTPVWKPLDAPYPGRNASFPTIDFDPTSNSVLIHTFTEFLRYDLEKGTLEKVLDDNILWNMTGRVDPTTGTFVLIGAGSDQSGAGGLKIFTRTAKLNYTVDNRTQRMRDSKTCDEVLNAAAPGVAFDPVLTRFVVWPNQLGNVYLLDLDANRCQKLEYKGGPPKMDVGIYHPTRGRFRYFPKLGVFVAVPSAKSPAYALRLPATL
jgi:hypothetical protein